jgi:hypothetical protein
VSILSWPDPVATKIAITTFFFFRCIRSPNVRVKPPRQGALGTMTFDRVIKSLSDQMHMAASIGTAMGQARSQRDYATAASLLAILQGMSLRGAIAESACEAPCRSANGYLF